MSKRSSATAANGNQAVVGASKAGSEERMSTRMNEETREAHAEGKTEHHANHPPNTAYDKQKDLLSKETGHFSLIRAREVGMGVPSKYCALPVASLGITAAVTLKRASLVRPQRTKNARQRWSKVKSGT